MGQLLIVGAGIVGLSAAFHAARKGYKVTIVDEGPPEGGGCSYGNAGMVVPSHFIPLAAPGMVARGLQWMLNPESPFHIRPRVSGELLAWGWRFWRASSQRRVDRVAPLLRDLHLASRACFDEWAAGWGSEFGLVKNGLFMLCRTARGLEEEARAAQEARRMGIPAEVLGPEETASREPAVKMDVAGSVYFPLDCHLSPERLMIALRREVERAGVRIAWRTRAKSWRTSARRIVALTTDRGDLEADDYALCAGVWSARLGERLGVRIPMQAGKGYSITLQPAPFLPASCAILSEAKVAVTPMGTALRLGGTLEVTRPDDSGIRNARVRGILKSMSEYYPEFRCGDCRDTPVWFGLRPCSPDGLPYLGRVPRYDNLVVATGHAMMGVSLGPITGKLVAEVLARDTPSMPIADLRPDRYS